MMPFGRRHSLRYVLGLAGALLFILYLMKSSLLSGPAKSSESARLEYFMNHNPPKLITTANLRKSSFDWSQVPHRHLPPAKLIKLPEGRSNTLPPVQHSFTPETPQETKARQRRRDEVRRVFQYDWESYRKFAWKKDALNPISGAFKDQFSGWSATLVDSLDTLWIMGLRKEFDEAVEAVADIDFGESTSPRVNVFEPNIRYLGGLLSAYDLSKRDVLLAKAVEIGNLIYTGFNTANLMPVDFIDFEKAKLGGELAVEDWVVSASPGTLTLEMTRLSQITGDPKYYDACTRVMRQFHEQQQKSKIPGLWPTWVSMKTLNLSSRKEFTFGGGADSLYEYLPKMIALLGGLEPMYDEMTKNFMIAANKHMFFRPMLPEENDILISGNVDVDDHDNKPLDPESEHLTCFIGGTMALAGRLTGQPEDVETGAKLAKGCAYAYNAFPSGVMPERYDMVACEPRRAATCKWDEERWIKEGLRRPEWKEGLPKRFTTAKDPRYILRPEAIESLFLLYRITGDAWYQDTAWDMFQAVEKASRTKNGHAAIRDVNKATYDETRESNLEDYMESFWFAETLKYYYLIFSPPDLIDLDEFVLNTEAHPFRRWKSSV